MNKAEKALTASMSEPEKARWALRDIRSGKDAVALYNSLAGVVDTSLDWNAVRARRPEEEENIAKALEGFRGACLAKLEERTG
jgi:hypothetical protein